MPDEEGLDQHGERRRVAEGVERRPQHGDLEGPEEDRAEQRGIARAQVLERVAHAGRRRRGRLRELLHEPREPAAGAPRTARAGAAGRSG